MPAAYIEHLGPADAIRYGELPVPRVGPCQVLVRVEAAVVDPVDLLIRSGAYRTALTFPFIIGRDLAGTVARVGAMVTRFAPGERVWCNSLGYAGRPGSFAAYASVDQDRLYSLPKDVDPIEAVAILHPAATAFTGLVHHVGGLHPGQTILVGGGAGNVGSSLVQLARAMGAQVIATAHGTDDESWCRRWGAKAVFDYRDLQLEARIRQVAPAGVDVVWNTSGHYDLGMAVNVLVRDGCLVFMAGTVEPPVFPVGPFYTKNARAVGFAISNATVAAHIRKVLPFAQAAEAQQLVEAGQAHGRRIVLVPASP